MGWAVGAYIIQGGELKGESLAVPETLSASWPMLLRRVPEVTAKVMVVEASEAGGTKMTPVGND
jgi:hypothetical protein